MKKWENIGWALACLLGGCAGTGENSGAREPQAEPEPEPWEEAFGPDQSEQASASDDASDVAEDETAPGGEPNFTPGMSVTDAINAVPETIERLNIEQEALAAPLMKPELYEPCELQGHHHFKLRVAVWDGRAVGLDVETQPSDEKLEACLRQQISNVEWTDKAKSINTVEYNY